MADAKKADTGDGDQPKKKSKLMLIIVLVVVIAAVAAGGAFFMMKKNAAHSDEEGDEPPAKEEKVKKAKKDRPETPPVFVKLDQFVVKLQTETQDAYLQAVPELRVLDAQLGDKIKLYTPEIRHKLLLILSGKKASELGNPQGVQKLANEMRVAINHIIEPPPPRKKNQPAEEPDDFANPDDPVQAVLFTSFIIQ
jgi:flagellar FliL protein